MSKQFVFRETLPGGGLGPLVPAFPDRIEPLSVAEQMVLEVMTGMQMQLEIQFMQMAEQQRIIEEQQEAIEALKNNTTIEGAE